MRTILPILGLTLLSMPAAYAAPVFTTPMDLLGTLYNAYLGGHEVMDLDPYFSDRLEKEMQGVLLAPEVIQSLGVDPLVGAIGADVTMLNMDAVSEGERVAVEVRFHNREEPVFIRFELVEEAAHGWQIDHLRGKSGDVEWCTRSLVQAKRRFSDPEKSPNAQNTN